MTGDIFGIEGGDLWVVVVEGAGIFDLRAGSEDKKAAEEQAEEGPRGRREDWVKGEGFWRERRGRV